MYQLEYMNTYDNSGEGLEYPGRSPAMIPAPLLIYGVVYSVLPTIFQL